MAKDEIEEINLGEEEEKNPNPIYIVPDTVEEILLRLPLKSLLKFKIVSKQWKSVIESRNFTERRIQFQKKKSILAVGDGTKPRFQGDKEEGIEMFYIDCDVAETRPSLTCEGLVCIPVPDWVNILNPSTRQSLSFPCGPNPVTKQYDHMFGRGGHRWNLWWNLFPAYWTMGFGKDRVSGSYKVVRMFFNPTPICEILDVSIGVWRRVNPPAYPVESIRKSACVNGSIYWLEMNAELCVLALDLHTEEFRDVPAPPVCSLENQLVNLDNRLALAHNLDAPDGNLDIWILDAEEDSWTLAYSISLLHFPSPLSSKIWFRPVAISEQGNVFLHDNKKRLFKYYPETDFIDCLPSDICVLSPFVENLVPLQCFDNDSATIGFQTGDQVPPVPGSRIGNIFGRIKLDIPSILITTSLVSLVVCRFLVLSSRS